MERILQEKYRNYETEQLVLLYQNSHDEYILREIMRRDDGLLRIWVKDYDNIPYCSYEDLLEEATIALWNAVEHFERDRGITFSSCLKGFVKQRFNRLYMEVTRKKRFTGQEPVSYESLEEIHKEASIEVKR